MAETCSHCPFDPNSKNSKVGEKWKKKMVAELPTLPTAVHGCCMVSKTYEQSDPDKQCHGMRLWLESQGKSCTE